MRGIPPDHGREQGQAQGQRHVGPRRPQAPPCRGPEDEIEHDPDRQQDRVVLAQQGPAPGQADPQPGAVRPGVARATARRSSVRSQKNSSGPSGWAMVPTTRP